MSHANRRTIVVLLGAALFAPAQLAADTAPAAGLPTQESPDTAPAAGLPTQESPDTAPAAGLPTQESPDTAPAAGLPTQESPDTAPAAGLPTQESLMDELKSGLYWRVNVLGFGVFQDLVDNSRLNPNNVLKVPTYQAAVNPRVDLNLNFRQLELGIKERFLYLRQGWNEGLPKDQEDTRTEFYTNEWFARYRLTDEVLASYGRENLQWGPSVFLSSSNPFNQENGRNNPWVEEPGLGYVRAVWTPNSTWSGSFIANYDKGRLGEFGPSLSTDVLTENPGNLEQAMHFKRGYALKLDWTGDGKYFSFIPSLREDTGYRFGFFGGWNVTDALLLYGEGSDGDFNGFELQAGGSYTFEAGQMVNMEYFHNENGCLDSRIDQCFTRGRISSNAPLIRSDYLMAQYAETDVWAGFNVTFRVIHNLNDQSNLLVGIVDHDVGEHAQLYLIVNGFTGSRDTEFGSLLRYSLFAGGAYTF